MLLGGTGIRKMSKFNKRPGPSKVVHGGFFYQKTMSVHGYLFGISE